MRAGASAVLAAALAVAGSAAAGGIGLQIITVRATQTGPSDPEVASLRPRLKRLVPFRSFHVVQDEVRQCAWRSEEAFSIPGGRSLVILPKGMADETVTMQVRLLDGRHRLVDTHVRLRNRGTMLFGVGRSDRDEDGAMIIVLRARQ
ncbi:MAG: hypothetical protein U0807_07460 [Candidatus Binatia bacterium]